MSEFKIVPSEANDWWRRTEPSGILLNRLMLLFIVVPIALVFKTYYVLSFVIFAFMIPYGFLLRYLAARAVRRHIETNPEELEEFERQGIVSD
jgi:Flp pilus assembly protein TadB